MTYPNYFSQFQPQYQPQQYLQPQMIQQPASTFVTVRNIEEAQNYPVAPNNSVMFKDENAPYVYTKTMGASQLDRPIFEVFKLVKEEAKEEPKSFDYRTEIDDLRKEVERLRNLVEVEVDE